MTENQRPRNERREKEWIDDFNEFMSTSPNEPPASLGSAVMSRVRTDLHPMASLVFMKLALIHAIVGTSTLLVCPQFGFHLLPGMGLMTVFEMFGEIGCTLACGALFLSGSFLLASLLLRSEEVRVIRKTKFLQLVGLGALSIGVFVLFGFSVVMVGALVWLLGSVGGGLATLELGWLFRSRWRQRLAA